MPSTGGFPGSAEIEKTDSEMRRHSCKCVEEDQRESYLEFSQEKMEIINLMYESEEENVDNETTKKLRGGSFQHEEEFMDVWNLPF